jgi:hypothetical protein
MFMSLKINKINEILVVHKLLNTNQLKSNKLQNKLTLKGRPSNVLCTCEGIDLAAVKGHNLYVLEPCWKR